MNVNNRKVGNKYVQVENKVKKIFKKLGVKPSHTELSDVIADIVRGKKIVFKKIGG